MTNKEIRVLAFVATAAIAVCCVVIGIRHHPSTESSLTVEEQRLLNKIQDAQAQLDQTKSDIQEMLSDAKAAAVSINTNNVNIQWVVIAVNGQPLLQNTTTGKGIEWGFRDDGAVIWKTQ